MERLTNSVLYTVMPRYIFQNKETKEYVEVFQSMNEPHIYEEDGVEFQRIFTVPNMSIDSMGVNPYSQKDYIKKTDKKMTLGEIMDFSSELSESRAAKEGGVDPIKKNYFDKYQKENKVKHFQDKPKVIETKQVKIEF